MGDVVFELQLVIVGGVLRGVRDVDLLAQTRERFPRLAHARHDDGEIAERREDRECGDARDGEHVRREHERADDDGGDDDLLPQPRAPRLERFGQRLFGTWLLCEQLAQPLLARLCFLGEPRRLGIARRVARGVVRGFLGEDRFRKLPQEGGLFLLHLAQRIHCAHWRERVGDELLILQQMIELAHAFARGRAGGAVRHEAHALVERGGRGVDLGDEIARRDVGAGAEVGQRIEQRVQQVDRRCVAVAIERLVDRAVEERGEIARGPFALTPQRFEISEVRGVAMDLQLVAHRRDQFLGAAGALGDERLRLEAFEERLIRFDADAGERSGERVIDDELFRAERRGMSSGVCALQDGGAQQLGGETRLEALQCDLARKYELRVAEGAERRMHAARMESGKGAAHLRLEHQHARERAGKGVAVRLEAHAMRVHRVEQPDLVERLRLGSAQCLQQTVCGRVIGGARGLRQQQQDLDREEHGQALRLVQTANPLSGVDERRPRRRRNQQHELARRYVVARAQWTVGPLPLCMNRLDGLREIAVLQDRPTLDEVIETARARHTHACGLGQRRRGFVERENADRLVHQLSVSIRRT